MSKSKKIQRFETLDAFRGLAAVMVVLLHSHFYIYTEPNTFIYNSYVFVDFFFVLSGFVMAYSYKDRILEGISFKKFVLLRFARLYPLHLFTLLVWVPFVGVKYYLYYQGIGESDPAESFSLYMFIQNLFLLHGFGSSTSWNFPSWSIGAEFYTYILFFTVVLITLRLPSIIRYLIYVVIILLIMINNQNEVFSLGYMFRCISGFFLGVLVYALYKHTSLRIKSVVVATILETILLLAMVYMVHMLNMHSMAMFYTLILFALIVYLFAIENIGYISKLLMLVPFQHLGKISYSIYMIHAIVVVISYKIFTFIWTEQMGSVTGVSKGIVIEYALYLNVLLLIVIVWLSTLTYKFIEIPGQAYIKKRFLKYEQ